MPSILENAYTDAAAVDQDPILDDPRLDVSADELYGPRLDFTWLKAKTGPGTIDDYVNHPLNMSGSRGVAQMLRGFTGLAGDLDLAIIDIGLGLVEVIKEKKIETIADQPGK